MINSLHMNAAEIVCIEQLRHHAMDKNCLLVNSRKREHWYDHLLQCVLGIVYNYLDEQNRLRRCYHHLGSKQSIS